MFIVLYVLLAAMLFFPPFELPARKGGIHKEYLSLSNTASVKGFFVALVFCSHYLSYVELSDSLLDAAFVGVIKKVGQMMVAPFFFYSGYGTFVSILTKRKRYVMTFFKKRLFPLWLGFEFCLLLYLIAGIMRGNHYTLLRILSAMSGWTGIGNSNWFIFDTFILYILIIVCFYHMDETGLNKALCFFTAGVLMMIMLLSITKEPWWYNTLLCFPFGMWIGKYKETLENLIVRWYYPILSGTCFLLVIFYRVQTHYPIIYLIVSALFVFFVMLVTMKIQCRSYICEFLGKHVFSIYMLQRLFFSTVRMATSNPYLVFAIPLVCTILTAVPFDIAMAKVKAVTSGQEDFK